jgi:hypothetical protein
MRTETWNVELCTHINKCKITNWIEVKKNRADWKKSIKEAKAYIIP